jgi:hypothetical protein
MHEIHKNTNIDHKFLFWHHGNDIVVELQWRIQFNSYVRAQWYENLWIKDETNFEAINNKELTFLYNGVDKGKLWFYVFAISSDVNKKLTLGVDTSVLILYNLMFI